MMVCSMCVRKAETQRERERWEGEGDGEDNDPLLNYEC